MMVKRDRSFLRRALRAGTLLLLLAGACDKEDRVAPLSEQLVGKWRLSTLRGQTPHLRDWHIEFAADHTWHYAGTLDGLLAGMTVSGHGRWYVQGRTLVTTAGDAHGASVCEISGVELTLKPDPVLTSASRSPVDSTYRRVSGFGH